MVEQTCHLSRYGRRGSGKPTLYFTILVVVTILLTTNALGYVLKDAKKETGVATSRYLGNATYSRVTTTTTKPEVVQTTLYTTTLQTQEINATYTRVNKTATKPEIVQSTVPAEDTKKARNATLSKQVKNTTGSGALKKPEIVQSTEPNVTKVKSNVTTFRIKTVSVDIKDVGYDKGPALFAIAFNNTMKMIKPEIQSKIRNAEDAELTAKVITTVALRETKKEMLRTSVVQSTSDTIALKGLVLDKSTGDEVDVTPSALDKRLTGIKPEFRKKMEFVALFGNTQEKMMLKRQIGDYVGLKEKNERPVLVVRVTRGEIDTAKVMDLLRKQKSVDEILKNLNV